MPKPSRDFVSYWIDSAPGPGFPKLEGDISADVAVVGAGIVGITAGYLLARQGVDVVVVDRGTIAGGVTGYTTAKVTSSHGLIYGQLVKKFGEAGARTYGVSNQAALEKVASLVDEHDIECDFERADNYVYAPDEGSTSDVREEADVAARLGLPASFTNESELPFPTAGAVRFADQAQFHPRRYLLALARRIAEDGGRIFENTVVTGVEEGKPTIVSSDGGRITAADVILATHMPLLDRGLFFTKVHPYRSYVVAGPVEDDDAPRGMYISAGGSTRSIRSTPHDGSRLVLVGGEGHKTGTVSDTLQQYEALERSARDWYGIAEPEYRWATQDNVSIDKVPYIGRLTRGSDHAFVATGFGKWGMTNGTLAAMILSDHIVGRPNEWASFYDAKRIAPRASATTFAKENAEVAAHFVGDRVMPGTRGNPRCTHLGCVLRENRGEGTWDCPCHGSRFAADGTVIQGPAVRDLKQPERR